MKSKILNILRIKGDYVSGQELCEYFGVTRTAIWKGIRQLREEGYQIDAVKNKGYRLLESPDLITDVELGSRMDTNWAGGKLVYLDEVDSTNNYARKLAEDGVQHGTLVVADYQNGGKGRRGRTWVMPHRKAIAMSLIVRPDIRPEKASMMTLVTGMAVAEAIKKVTGLDTKIKWPNDIVINGKKISGILTEMSAEMDGINYVVIGIGINANFTEFPEELRETATSLQQQLGYPVDRGAIICMTMKIFEIYYERFMETQSMKGLAEEYQQMLANLDRQVRVLEPGNEYSGVARGIDETGQLLVEKENGETVAVYAGEVSVRGIYNYV